jgi:hypothetical protein
MTRITLFLASAIAFAAPAIAQENAFPQVQNDGEGQVTIQYGAGPRGNVVGGGVASVTGNSDARPELSYNGQTRAQAPGAPVGRTTVPTTAAQGA